MTQVLLAAALFVAMLAITVSVAAAATAAAPIY